VLAAVVVEVLMATHLVHHQVLVLMGNLELEAVAAAVLVIHQPVVTVALVLSSSSAINKVNHERQLSRKHYY
jgi:hypothetical protein